MVIVGIGQVIETNYLIWKIWIAYTGREKFG
jgi:hypothetical protein